MGIKRKVLVAVSGGSDSMYLLYLTKKSSFLEPVALHVNYKKRETAERDQQLVEEFCKKNNISLYVKQVSEEDWKSVSFLNGFQAKAREIRYRYFESMSKKLGTNKILIGHNRDDFLETAIMQDDKSNEYLFYGIEKKSFHHNLEIERPLIKKSKNFIAEKCNLLNIPFGIDETNLQQQYERNKVRFELLSRSDKEKKVLYKHFNSLNKSKELFRKKVNKLFSQWQINGYLYDFYKGCDEKYQIQLIYKLLTNSKIDLNINKNKILGIVDFLRNKHSVKKYRLMDNLFIEIRNDKIVFIKDEEV